MTTKNNIPAGYKDSVVGIIPQEWEVKPVKDFGKVVTGNTPSTAEVSNYGDEYMFVSPVDLSDDKKYIFRTEKMLSSKGYAVSRKMPKGAILYTCIGSTIGKIGIASCELTSNQQINAVICDDNNEYFYYALLFLTGRIKMLAGEQAVPIINKSDFERIKLAVPPMEEQRKIAEILGVWDEAIEKQSRLIERLELRKRALMQRLLSGRTRLPGFTTPWQKIKLGEICEEYILRNTEDNNYIVLSCTKYNGLVSSLDYFGKQIFSDNLRTYKVVPKYHFAYATNHIEEGSIGYQGCYDYALISPMYTVFKTDDKKVDNYFLYRLLKTPLMIYNYQSRIEGSIDRRGGLRWDAFAGITIKLPSLPEQKAIAEVLTAADNEIATHRKKLDALRLQKRGLMQQLLTGKTRVKI